MLRRGSAKPQEENVVNKRVNVCVGIDAESADAIATWCGERDLRMAWFARRAILEKAIAMQIIPDRPMKESDLG